jgi:hypothetical protein
MPFGIRAAMVGLEGNMSLVVKSLVTLIVVAAVLAIYVIVEVIVAMIAYMYLALNHAETFGYLVGLSRDVLNLFANQLEYWAPDLANQAYTTLLGELGPKSILLLLIGLIVGAIIRLAGWTARHFFFARRDHA